MSVKEKSKEELLKYIERLEGYYSPSGRGKVDLKDIRRLKEKQLKS